MTESFICFKPFVKVKTFEGNSKQGKNWRTEISGLILYSNKIL
jgi:hypothetical protein